MNWVAVLVRHLWNVTRSAEEGQGREAREGTVEEGIPRGLDLVIGWDQSHRHLAFAEDVGQDRVIVEGLGPDRGTVADLGLDRMIVGDLGQDRVVILERSQAGDHDLALDHEAEEGRVQDRRERASAPSRNPGLVIGIQMKFVKVLHFFVWIFFSTLLFYFVWIFIIILLLLL